MKAHHSFSWKSLQAIARILTTVLFDLKVYGGDNIPARGGVLIVSNHQGNLDPVLLAVRLHRPLSYIAKAELFENPFAGWLLKSILNAFPVHQGAADVYAVRQTIRRLKDGQVLNMYPEGGRTVDGRIAELQKGVALIVRRAHVPVIPAVISGSYEAWPIHRKWFRSHRIRVQFGRPMKLDSLDSDEIVATIDRTLRQMLDNMNHRAR